MTSSLRALDPAEFDSDDIAVAAVRDGLAAGYDTRWGPAYFGLVHPSNPDRSFAYRLERDEDRPRFDGWSFIISERRGDTWFPVRTGGYRLDAVQTQRFLLVHIITKLEAWAK